MTNSLLLTQEDHEELEHLLMQQAQLRRILFDTLLTSKSFKPGSVLTKLGLLVGLFVKEQEGPEGENDFLDLFEARYRTRAEKYGEAWAKAYYLRDLVRSLLPLGSWFLHRVAAWEAIKRMLH